MFHYLHFPLFDMPRPISQYHNSIKRKNRVLQEIYFVKWV